MTTATSTFMHGTHADGVAAARREITIGDYTTSAVAEYLTNCERAGVRQPRSEFDRGFMETFETFATNGAL